jgi:hypothetical protein
MNWPSFEPLGGDINKSDDLHAVFPTNKQLMGVTAVDPPLSGSSGTILSTLISTIFSTPWVQHSKSQRGANHPTNPLDM